MKDMMEEVIKLDIESMIPWLLEHGLATRSGETKYEITPLGALVWATLFIEIPKDFFLQVLQWREDFARRVGNVNRT